MKLGNSVILLSDRKRKGIVTKIGNVFETGDKGIIVYFPHEDKYGMYSPSSVMVVKA